MPKQLICDQAPSDRCPPRFRLRSPGWIGATNFGDAEGAEEPPAGIRLRWTLPFLSARAKDRKGRPKLFTVERAGPLSTEGMAKFDPHVGHRSRTPTPEGLWRLLDRIDGLTFGRVGEPCRGFDAIAFEVPKGLGPTTVTLVDVHGVPQVEAEVREGQTFHFELPDIALVCFSRDVRVQKLRGLDLASGLDVDFIPIAEIDADLWHRMGADALDARISRADGTTFRAPDAADWDELARRGALIDDAFTQGSDLEAGVVDGLRLVAETSFTMAALIGCGFVDGEHPADTKPDKVRRDLMLDAPSEALYAYRVRASLEGSGLAGDEDVSTVCFASARPAPRLGQARCRAVEPPVARLEPVTPVSAGTAGGLPTRSGATADRTFCSGRWEIVSGMPWDEVVTTRPLASNSVITGRTFEASPTFLAGSNPPPRRVRGRALVEVREHAFEIPFFDCEVGMEAQVADFWDRIGRPSPADMIPPRIEYTGSSLPLATAACRFDEALGRGRCELDLDAQADWRGDLLASASGARVRFLMQRPDELPDAAEAVIGPAWPEADGHWRAELFTTLEQSRLDRFVGGTLAVGAFVGQVHAVGAAAGGSATIQFDAPGQCGGAALYDCPSPQVRASLSEDPRSARLWIELDGTVDLGTDGKPVVYSGAADLPELTASRTLHFATRLAFAFMGREYATEISVPVSAPYIHPAPLAPAACLGIVQLHRDFYDREFVRVEARCPALDERYRVRLEMAPGRVGTADAFAAVKTSGPLGVQAPFEGAIVFEGFDRLARLSEGAAYTVGSSYVREEDQRQSMPALASSVMRRCSSRR